MSDQTNSILTKDDRIAIIKSGYKSLGDETLTMRTRAGDRACVRTCTYSGQVRLYVPLVLEEGSFVAPEFDIAVGVARTNESLSTAWWNDNLTSRLLHPEPQYETLDFAFLKDGYWQCVKLTNPKFLERLNLFLLMVKGG